MPNSAMTWFYNDEGAAQGPMDESGMMSLINAGKIYAHTLIWHKGLELWAEAGTLNPSWWQPVLEKTKQSAGTESFGTRSSHRSPIPLAPTEAPKKAKSDGLLKRLFGGKKKP